MFTRTQSCEDGYDRVDNDEWLQYSEQENVRLFWQAVIVVLILIWTLAPAIGH